MREKEQPEADGLGPLQVGVGRRQHVLAVLRLAQQRSLDPRHAGIQRVHRSHRPQPQSRDGLVVPRPPCAQFARQPAHFVGQQPLHERVNILVRRRLRHARRQSLSHALQPAA